MSEPQTHGSPRLARPTILVVEDDATLRGLLGRALSDAGYEVVTASDGRVAAQRAAEVRVDLVVTDIYMPGDDGVTLMMHLRDSAPQIPVIVISGGFRGTRDSMLRVVRSLGARRTLEKPFSLDALLDAVRETLGPPGPEESTHRV